MDEQPLSFKELQEMDKRNNTFLMEDGTEITTYDDSIEDVVEMGLAPLRDFLELIDEDAEGEIAKIYNVCNVLIEDMERKFDELSRFIRDHYGWVKVRRAQRGQMRYLLADTMLDVVVREPRKGAEDGDKN